MHFSMVKSNRNICLGTNKFIFVLSSADIINDYIYWGLEIKNEYTYIFSMVQTLFMPKFYYGHYLIRQCC